MKNEIEILDLKKSLLLLERDNIKLKHKNELEELALKDKFDREHFDRQSQLIRMKSAEIRKQQERKGWQKFGEEYSR